MITASRSGVSDQLRQMHGPSGSRQIRAPGSSLAVNHEVLTRSDETVYVPLQAIARRGTVLARSSAVPKDAGERGPVAAVSVLAPKVGGRAATVRADYHDAIATHE